MHNVKIVARPWQPQDLIDDLQEIIDEECDNYLNTRRTTLCMALDFLKEHFAEQKWIPVTERLPEEDKDVLVFGYYHETFQTLICHYRSDFKGQWFTSVAGQQVYEVTHWMPLPDPPKGD